MKELTAWDKKALRLTIRELRRQRTSGKWFDNLFYITKCRFCIKYLQLNLPLRPPFYCKNCPLDFCLGYVEIGILANYRSTVAYFPSKRNIELFQKQCLVVANWLEKRFFGDK